MGTKISSRTCGYRHKNRSRNPGAGWGMMARAERRVRRRLRKGRPRRQSHNTIASAIRARIASAIMARSIRQGRRTSGRARVWRGRHPSAVLLINIRVIDRGKLDDLDSEPDERHRRDDERGELHRPIITAIGSAGTRSPAAVLIFGQPFGRASCAGAVETTAFIDLAFPFR